MAGGGGGGGGKRSANADLNLVPYIDLLSTLICFLLITAVWQQVNVVSTNIEKSKPEGEAGTFNPNPLQKDEEKIEIILTLKKRSVEINANKNLSEITNLPQTINKELITKALVQWRNDYPDKKLITIKSESNAEYKTLIQTMDLLTENKFSEVAISTQ